MPGTLDAVNAIPQRLQKLGCPLSAFVALWGQRSQAYLAMRFSGNAPLPSPEAVVMQELLDRMEELEKSVAPLPINWSLSGRVKMALEICKARRDFCAGALALGVE